MDFLNNYNQTIKENIKIENIQKEDNVSKIPIVDLEKEKNELKNHNIALKNKNIVLKNENIELKNKKIELKNE